MRRLPEPAWSLFLAEGSASVQRCARCGAITPELSAEAECATCGGLFEIVHATPDVHGAALLALFGLRSGLKPSAEPSGVWRYRELVMPGSADVVSHPEGNTPLLERQAVQSFARSAGLLLKHEGHNPTGSFKDRGMTVAVTQAKRIGARAVACASTGNTSASLASYAAHAGIPALVFVPRGQIAIGKLTQSLAYGARTLLVDGDFDACLRLARESSRELGVYLVNSINPWRVEGQKTIVFEMLQQLGYDAPDWIALPAGNLGNTSAFGKALREAFALGLITRMPRLLAVQAAGAAPFAASFAKQFSTHETVHAETLATAIKIGDPASWDRAVRAITETNGVVTSVSDDEILESKAVIDACGVGCEPASAASVAGVRQMRERGVIGENERVVAVLTGHLLKDPGAIQRYHQEIEPRPKRANRPIEIEATVSAVERVLRSALMLIIALVLSSEALSAQGRVYHFRSKILGEERYFHVSLPPNYSVAKQRYQVTYLLDGHVKAFFDLAVASAGYDVSTGGPHEFAIPPQIVVGVEQKNRSFDLATNQEAFDRFLAEELVPFIDKEFRTVPYRTLIGHSLGGRFALFTFCRNPGMFPAIVAISPGGGDSTGFKSLTDCLRKDFGANRTVLRQLVLSAGDQEERLLASTLKLRDFVRDSAPPNWRMLFVDGAGLGHTDTPFSTIPRGIRFVHEGAVWEMPAAQGDSVVAARGDESEKRVAQFYKSLSARVGYTVPPPVKWLLITASAHLRRSEHGLGLAAAKRATDEYPEDVDGWSVLTDACLADSDNECARRALEDALRIVDRLELYDNETRARQKNFFEENLQRVKARP